MGAAALPVTYFLDYNRDGFPDAVNGYQVHINRGGGPPFDFSEKVSVMPEGETIRHDSGSGDDWFWPRLFDFDGDGDFDILFGDWDGTIWLHKKDAAGYDRRGHRLLHEDGSPIQVGPLRKRLKNDGFNNLQGARTVFVADDFDADGRNDLVVGDNYGEIYFARNTGSNVRPVFASLVKFGDLGSRNGVSSHYCHSERVRQHIRNRDGPRIEEFVLLRIRKATRWVALLVEFNLPWSP